jgi:hypothetical protein
MLSLEQNEWSARTNETVRTILYVIPNNKFGVRTNQNKGETHVIIIDRTRYDYRQNNLLLQ